jgi:hypothetical protein
MPALLLASMITVGGNQAPAVIMDCRDKPGNDSEKCPDSRYRTS